MRLPISRWMKWASASMVIFLAGWAPPVRAEVLLFTEAASALDTYSGHICSQQVNSFGPLVTSQCGPTVETGSPPLPYVTTLSASSQAFSANGGAMGVSTMAAVSSNFAFTFQSVQALALAQVFDNLQFVSNLVAPGGLMHTQVTVLVGTSFDANIAGPVQTIIGSDLFYKLNGHTLDVPNFANTPGLIPYSFA